MARDNDIKTNNPTDRVPQSGGTGIGGGAGTRDTGGQNPTGSRPGNEGGGNVSGTNFGTGNTGGGFGGGAKIRNFRCADVGHANCPWEVSGRTEEELRPQIEQHGRQQHGIKEFTEETWNKVRNAISERRAA